MQIQKHGGLVARVVGLWRYPVKSMGGEVLNEVDISWHGFAGDRRWAFVRDGVAQSGFPWLTLRERGDMNHYVPSFLDPLRQDEWVGRVLRVGHLRMRVDKRDGRCAVITIDPATSQREPSVLRAVAQQRQGCLGVYGSTVESGRIALNDDVLIVE